MIRIGVCGYGFVGKALVEGFKPIADFTIIDSKWSNQTYDDLSQENSGITPFIFICVPTPMQVSTNRLDSSIVKEVCDEIYNYYRGQTSFEDCPIVIIKSTVTPDVLQAIKKNCPGIKLVMNPEFLVEKTAVSDFKHQNRIVLGGEKEDVDKVAELYKNLWPKAKYWLTDLTTASLVKYMNNSFLALKVSFIAEWHRIAKNLNVDPKLLVHAFLGDIRVNKSHTEQPGPDGDYGFGGKCFPKDINAIIEYAKTLDCSMHTLEAAWQTNLEVRSNKDWETIEGAVTYE